jgi:hypothetical protein
VMTCRRWLTFGGTANMVSARISREKVPVGLRKHWPARDAPPSWRTLLGPPPHDAHGRQDGGHGAGGVGLTNTANTSPPANEHLTVRVDRAEPVALGPVRPTSGLS